MSATALVVRVALASDRGGHPPTRPIWHVISRVTAGLDVARRVGALRLALGAEDLALPELVMQLAEEVVAPDAHPDLLGRP
jgi:hypothetical protein